MDCMTSGVYEVDGAHFSVVPAVVPSRSGVSTQVQ